MGVDSKNDTPGPTPTVPLILNQRPVARGQLWPIRATNPNIAVVYATATGEVGATDGRALTWSEQFVSRYRTRFEVDLSDHHRKARLQSSPLTCRDQAHRFEATVTVGFRVADPEEVVRRNISDALPVVYGYVVGRLRPMARRFAIDEAAQAEEYINRACADATVLPEGITVFHCSVELEPDAAARHYIQSLAQADRNRVLGQGRHADRVSQVRSDELIKDIQLRAQLDRDREAAAELAGTPLDLEGLIRQHLIKHPEDTGQALEMLMRSEETRAARWELEATRRDTLLKFLVDKDVIRTADIPQVRDEVLRQLDAPPASQAPPKDSPAARPAAPIVWGGSTAARNPSEAPAAHGVVPVYALLDASQAAEGCRDDLNNALRSLHTVLANSPEVGNAIRLAVLACGERSEMRLPLTRVEWGTSVPLLPDTGAPCYAPAFETLLACVADIDRLKQTIPTVHRPIAFFLTTGQPQDDGRWLEAYQRLAAHRYAPTIVACGIGQASPRDVLRIATRPELAFAADPQTPAAQSAVQFSVLLQNTVLHLGRGVIAGAVDLVVECPQGLRHADEYDA